MKDIKTEKKKGQVREKEKGAFKVSQVNRRTLIKHILVCPIYTSAPPEYPPRRRVEGEKKVVYGDCIDRPRHACPQRPRKGPSEKTPGGPLTEGRFLESRKPEPLFG